MIWPIYTLLQSSLDVTNIVGTKVFRMVAPQDTVPPFVVWNTVAGSDTNYLSERPGIENPLIQIDCYSRSEPEVVTLATAVRNALELNAHQRGQPRDDYEGEPTKLYRISLDFSFWVNR